LVSTSPVSNSTHSYSTDRNTSRRAAPKIPSGDGSNSGCKVHSYDSFNTHTNVACRVQKDIKSAKTSSYVCSVIEPTSSTPPSKYFKPLTLNVSLYDCLIPGLVDTGSDLSLISYELYQKYLGHLPLFTTSTNLLAAQNNPLTTLGVLNVKVKIRSVLYPTTLYVVKNLCRPCILGRDLLYQLPATIDLEKQLITFKPRYHVVEESQPISYRIQDSITLQPSEAAHINLISSTPYFRYSQLVSVIWRFRTKSLSLTTRITNFKCLDLSVHTNCLQYT
jgi:hypothetical protein